jgi:hypothetical protein
LLRLGLSATAALDHKVSIAGLLDLTVTGWCEKICRPFEITGRMKIIIWLLILGLVVVGLAQAVGGALRRVDFDGKLRDVASQVEEKNHEDIKRQVVAEGSKLHLQLTPSEVAVQYAPTSDMDYAQRMVSRIGTFQNYRATITVDYTQPILFIPIKRHTQVSALIKSAAQAKRAQPMPE